jgi:3-oxoadipate enol-lactonase
MRVIVDDGVGLEVNDVGSGPALVLVHGFGGAKEDFADHVATLAEHSRVVTFDHRGHGDSDAPPQPGDYSLDRLAADVIGVTTALGIMRFRLLGHSMGGMVARRVALEHPELLDALVLMNTSPGAPPDMDAEIVELAIGLALEQGMAALKVVWDAFAPLGTPAHERLLVERPGYREFGDRKFASLSPVMWATMLREICDQPDQLDRLAGVRCPTLVVVGEQDRTFLASSSAIAGAIPGASLEVIADAGHSPQFENPDLWFAALDGFLRARSERARTR